MFLNDTQIRERLKTGDLLIEPFPGPVSLGPCSVDLRLGTSFCRFPEADATGNKPIKLGSFTPSHISSLFASRQFSTEIGSEFILEPHAVILCQTLEIIGIRFDLLGLTFACSSLSRFGLELQPSVLSIFPGFMGPLVFSLHNAGPISVKLAPGMRIGNLLFSDIARDGQQPLAASMTFTHPVTEASDKATIERLRDEMARKASRLRKSPVDRKMFGELLDGLDKGTSNDKGKALETLCVKMFAMIDGLTVTRTDARLAAEEIDIILRNDIDSGFWRTVGSPIIVECKNWATKVRSRDVTILSGNMGALGPDVKLGILVAVKGITSDARTKIREQRQQGRQIICIDKEALQGLRQGKHPVDIIQEQYDALWFI